MSLYLTQASAENSSGPVRTLGGLEFSIGFGKISKTLDVSWGMTLTASWGMERLCHPIALLWA